MTFRLGIDGDALRKPLTGVGRYVYYLCRELEQILPADAQFLAYSRLGQDALELPSQRWLLRQEPVPALRRIPSFVWLKTRGLKLCKNDRLDAFWAGRTLHPRLPQSVRTVCTVHDLNHVLVPETMQLSGRMSAQLWFHQDLALASAIVANSQGTANRLRDHFGLNVAKIVRPAASRAFRPYDESEIQPAQPSLAQVGVRRPYLLTVGTFEPRKNLKRLLRVFSKLKRDGHIRSHQLVVVGPKGWGKAASEEELQQAKADGVVLPGYVADEVLPVLFAAAETLIMPSVYEGFGMPVLEARLCGTPTVFTDIPELKEAGGETGIAVAPTDDALFEGILQAMKHKNFHAPQQEGDRPSWARGASALASTLTNDPALY